jgi:DNA polymerase-3 subunit epsilon
VNSPGDTHAGFAVIDVETTGFSPEDERIVEVGVVMLGPDGRETGSFSTLIDPGRDPGPTFVHRITPSMLEGAPDFATVQPFLAEQLTGRVLVGHNVDQFDLAFLRAECARAGGDALVPADVATVDTLCVAQAHLDLAGKARLVDCCTYFGLSWDDHHSALGDARVTADLFRSMRSRLGDDVLEIDAALAAAADTSWPGGSPVPPAVLVRVPGPGPDLDTGTGTGTGRRHRRHAGRVPVLRRLLRALRRH